MANQAKEDKPNTPKERSNWLQERRVQIETSEDHRKKKDSENNDDDEVYMTIIFIHWYFDVLSIPYTLECPFKRG